MTISEIIISIAVIFAAFMVLTTAVAMWRSPNALTRANLLGPTIGVALPVLVAANLLREWSTTGFDSHNFIRALIAITGLLVVSSISSYYIGRSVHGIEGAAVDEVFDPPRGGDNEECHCALGEDNNTQQKSSAHKDKAQSADSKATTSAEKSSAKDRQHTKTSGDSYSADAISTGATDNAAIKSESGHSHPHTRHHGHQHNHTHQANSHSRTAKKTSSPKNKSKRGDGDVNPFKTERHPKNHD